MATGQRFIVLGHDWVDSRVKVVIDWITGVYIYIFL